LTLGLNGGSSSLFSSARQSKPLKNAWALMLASPLTPQPKRLGTERVKNYQRGKSALQPKEVDHFNTDILSKQQGGQPVAPHGLMTSEQ
jgi:hypothetical protein